MASRVGAGKLRHVSVAHLWLQDLVQKKEVEVRKISGERNPADILTKPKYLKEMIPLLKKVGVFKVYFNKDQLDADG